MKKCYNIIGDFMKLLKKDAWWIWLILFIFSEATSTLVLGALLDVYEKDAWYTKWYIWVICLILIIPFIIVYNAFNIQITSRTAAKLDIKGYEYYLSPYIWIILIIIPFIGWGLFVILYFYLTISILIKLHDGNAEKYIN